MILRSTCFLRTIIILSIPFSLFSCSTSIQGTKVDLKQLTPFEPEQRYIAAVLPYQFKGEQAEYGNLSDKLIDMTVVELFKTKRFRIVERSRIDATIEEIKLSQQGVTEDKLANEIGKQVGAEMVLVGVLSAITPIKKRDTVGVASILAQGFEVALQGRLIDISKGEVIAVGQANSVEIHKEHMAMGAKTGLIDSEETQLNRALEKAVKILVNDIASQVQPRGPE